jgi:hypothetical protein
MPIATIGKKIKTGNRPKQPARRGVAVDKTGTVLPSDRQVAHFFNGITGAFA